MDDGDDDDDDAGGPAEWVTARSDRSSRGAERTDRQTDGNDGTEEMDGRTTGHRKARCSVYDNSPNILSSMI